VGTNISCRLLFVTMGLVFSDHECLQAMRDESAADHTDAARGKHLAGFESKTFKL
jgi:hypothetical protein